MVWAYFLLPMFGWNAVYMKWFVCSWYTVFPMSLLIIKWHVLPFARVCLYKVCSICKVWLLNTMGRLLFAVFFIDVLVTRVCCAIWFELFELCIRSPVKTSIPTATYQIQGPEGSNFDSIAMLCCSRGFKYFCMPSFMSSFCVTLFIRCSFLIWCAIFLLLLCSLSYLKMYTYETHVAIINHLLTNLLTYLVTILCPFFIQYELSRPSHCFLVLLL